MLAKLGEVAIAKGLELVHVSFKHTAKNKPAFDFLESVAADYKTETADGLLFSIPADYAAGLTYSPANAIEYGVDIRIRHQFKEEINCGPNRWRDRLLQNRDRVKQLSRRLKAGRSQRGRRATGTRG